LPARIWLGMIAVALCPLITAVLLGLCAKADVYDLPFAIGDTLSTRIMSFSPAKIFAAGWLLATVQQVTSYLHVSIDEYTGLTTWRGDFILHYVASKHELLKVCSDNREMSCCGQMSVLMYSNIIKLALSIVFVTALLPTDITCKKICTDPSSASSCQDTSDMIASLTFGDIVTPKSGTIIGILNTAISTLTSNGIGMLLSNVSTVDKKWSMTGQTCTGIIGCATTGVSVMSVVYAVMYLMTKQSSVDAVLTSICICGTFAYTIGVAWIAVPTLNIVFWLVGFVTLGSYVGSPAPLHCETSDKTEMLLGDLPPGWSTGIDKASGQRYYTDPDGSTTWMAPDTTTTATAVAPTAKPGLVAEYVQPQGYVPPTSAPTATLPPGWSSDVDPTHGVTYYIKPDGSSTWDAPSF